MMLISRSSVMGQWLTSIQVMALLLTHWGQVMHICVSKLTIIGSDNGLSPVQRHAIIWTNAGILLIKLLGINFSDILIWIQTFSFKRMHLKMLSAKWLPCLSLNALKGYKPLSEPKLANQASIWGRLSNHWFYFSRSSWKTFTKSHWKSFQWLDSNQT